MTENEKKIEVVEIIEEDEAKADMVTHKEITVSELLKKNNELLEYRNGIMVEHEKMTNLNIKVNIAFKLVLIPAAIVFCLFLYKMYEEVLISNQKEMTIVNNLPQQETPVFNVNLPQPTVAVNNHTVLDKISFYRGGYHGTVYKNTSKNIVYCRTDATKEVYDIIISPNSNLEIPTEIVSCKDAELVEIRNPNEPRIYNQEQLFKIQ